MGAYLILVEGFPQGMFKRCTKVKFISPAKVEFCVKNISSAASGFFQVRITIFHGAKKDSRVYCLLLTAYLFGGGAGN
jgi:hypothetical protein